MNITNKALHLWLVHEQEVQDPILLQSYHELLSPEESLRYQKFIFPKHRHQFLVSRALVRSVLAQYCSGLGQESNPSKLKFSNNAYGRPALVSASGAQPVYFNLSHTDGIIVLAVSLNESVGVDVESLARKVDVINLAKRFFSPSEYNDLCKLPSEMISQRFFDLWTLKESYIKACGMGLSIPLDEFNFSFVGDAISIAFAEKLKGSRQDDAALWCFWQFLSNQDNNKIALALKAKNSLDYRISSKSGIPLQGFKKVQLKQIRKTDGRLG